MKTSLAVLFVGLAARWGAIALVAQPGPTLPDEIQYWDMADSLARGNGLRDELGFRAGRMPLYPAYLSIFTTIPNGHLWSLMIQALIGSIACPVMSAFAFRLAWQHGMANPRRIALLAGLFVAVDPFLVYFNTLALTESLFICAWCAFLSSSWPLVQAQYPACAPRWWASGLLFAACVYLKPSVIAFLLPWSLWIIVRRGCTWSVLSGLATWCMILLLSLYPWAARNKQLLGQAVWLTTRNGISLYDGVGPQADGSSNLAEVKRMPVVAGLGEIEWDAYFRRESWTCLTTEPRRALALAAVKFLRTWSFWPNAQDYQNPMIKAVCGVWTLIVLVSAIVAVVLGKLGRSTVLILLVPALYFTALHLFYVGSVRYRLPAMPMIEILSAVGFSTLLTIIARRASEPRSAKHGADIP